MYKPVDPMKLIGCKVILISDNRISRAWWGAVGTVVNVEIDNGEQRPYSPDWTLLIGYDNPPGFEGIYREVEIHWFMIANIIRRTVNTGEDD